MREIEKMMALLEKLDDANEKKAVREAVDTLNDAVDALINGTKEYLITGEKKRPGMDAAMEALNTLRESGAKHGIEFEKIEDRRDMAMYLVGYAGEIIFS